MLLKVFRDFIEQRCDACGAERELSCASLEAGLVLGDPPMAMNPNIIALPSCTDCGAREFLQRVASTDRAELTKTADHRRGVNALHALLVAAGRAAPRMLDRFADEPGGADEATIPWTFAGRKGGE